MDNYKLVTISIFNFFKHEKDAIFVFMKICFKNFYDLAVCNKIFFLFENVLKFFF